MDVPGQCAVVHFGKFGFYQSPCSSEIYAQQPLFRRAYWIVIACAGAAFILAYLLGPSRQVFICAGASAGSDAGNASLLRLAVVFLGC